MTPAPARPGELRRPRVRPRLLASIIDLVAGALLGTGALLLLGTNAGVELRAGALLVATAVPTVLSEVVVGRSLGKAAMQLRHVRPDEPVPDVLTFVGRWGLKWLLPAMLVVMTVTPWTWAPLVWLLDGLPAIRGDRRALHDRLSGTRVWELVTTEP